IFSRSALSKRRQFIGSENALANTDTFSTISRQHLVGGRRLGALLAERVAMNKLLTVSAALRDVFRPRTVVPKQTIVRRTDPLARHHAGRRVGVGLRRNGERA